MALPLHDDNSMVVLANALAESRYRLTLQEKRIILWLIAQVDRDDDDFKTYRTDIDTMLHYLGLDRGKAKRDRVNELRQITKRLRERTLEVPDPANSRFIQCGWVDTVTWNLRESVIEFRLSYDLKPYLLGLDREFTMLLLTYALSLSSFHAIRIYQLVKQYEAFGNRRMTVDELRELCGIEPGSYRLYGDLKKRVLEIGKREINEKTDLAIDYREHKRGRRVEAVTFNIQRRPDPPANIPDLPGKPDLHAALERRLVEHGVKPATAKRHLKTWGDLDPDRLIWHLDELERRIRENAGFSGLEGPLHWLQAGLKNDFRPQPSLFEQRTETEQVERRRKSAETVRKSQASAARREGIERRYWQIEKSYRAALCQRLEALVASLDPAVRAGLGQRFRAGLDSDFLRGHFDRRGWADGMIGRQAADFLRGEGHEIEPIEAFAARQGVTDWAGLRAEYRELAADP